MKRLENEVERVRKEHTERINQIKLNSEYELEQQRVDQEEKLKEIRREADQVSSIVYSFVKFDWILILGSNWIRILSIKRYSWRKFPIETEITRFD